MTLIEHFPETFTKLKDSVLKHLISKIEAVDFDKDEIKEGKSLENKVLIGEHVPTADFLKLFVENGISNVVQTKNDDLAYEVFIAAVILLKPKLFLNNPLTILNSQESPDSKVHVWQEGFNSSEQKSGILEGIQGFIGKNKAMNRLSDNILIVIDELLTNALFSAPVDEQGQPLFADKERSETVEYPPNKTAMVFAVHTENDLFIGAVDPFGSVDRDTICKALHTAYSKGQVNESTQGAGFGLRMMLDRARSLYFLSEKGKRTLVCCHMRLNVSLKKVEHVPKQLHISVT